MKILVAGGLSPANSDAEQSLARALGRAVGASGHVLVNGCYNTFDLLVAEAADEATRKVPAGNAATAILTYLSPGVEPRHKFGKLLKNNVSSWDPGQPDWGIPVPLRECEAVVVVGGGPSTHRVVHLSRLVGKPLLPVTAFGGAADEAFRPSFERFDVVYGGRVTRDELQRPQHRARGTRRAGGFRAIGGERDLAVSKILSGNDIFVVMSFREESDDTYHTIERVCRSYDFKANRTDKDAEHRADLQADHRRNSTRDVRHR